GSSSVPTGEWVHLVFIRTAGSGIRIFLDGALISENTAEIDLPRMDIGVRGPEGDRMAATLDEVVIYDKALTQSQTLAHFASLGGGAATDAILEVASNFVNVGTAPDDEDISTTFTLSNGGSSSPLTISEVTLTGEDSDHFTVLMPDSLAPGASGEAEVTFQSLGQQG